MTNPIYELSYIRASLDQLQAYLLSKELFWPVSPPVGIRSFPKLTLSSLLLAIKKLRAISSTSQLDPAQRTETAQLDRKISEIHQKWTAAWEAKAIREFRSRLRQWSHFLNDLEKNEEAHAPYYSSEVRVRVLIALLKEYATEDEKQALAQLDAVLQARLKPTDFIWNAELELEFPAQEFWFLYSTI